MKVLQTVAMLVTILILTTQGVRHVYVKYFESTSSVLHKYDKETAELRRQIEAAQSLAELDAMYAPARKAKDTLDEEIKAKVKVEEDKNTEDSSRRLRTLEESFRSEHAKDYEREEMLREGIRDWENRAEQIRELRVFWAFGLGLFVLGGLIYRFAPWLGMAFVMSGAVEMIWWSSPSFRFAGSPLEFERLLTNKLVFTGITLAVVVAAWLVLGALRRRGGETHGVSRRARTGRAGLLRMKGVGLCDG